MSQKGAAISVEMFPSVLVGSIHFDCAPYHTTLLTEHPNVVQLHFGGQPHPSHGCHLCAVLGEPPVWGPEPGCVLTPVAASSGVRDSYHSPEGALIPPPTARTGEFRLCAHLCSFPFLLASSHPIKKISSFGHFPRLGYGASSVKNAAFFLLSSTSTDSKPTVETLGPTVKSEETTTPYPMEEDVTECGENCSFEDGKDWDGHCISSGMAWVRTRRMAHDRART